MARVESQSTNQSMKVRDMSFDDWVERRAEAKVRDMSLDDWVERRAEVCLGVPDSALVPAATSVI